MPPPGIPGGPLIVTADLPADLQSWADGLRRAHFPPDRNFLPAHVTLFHGLPPASEAEVRRCLAALARNRPPPARLDGIMPLGTGTALRIASPALVELHDEMAGLFHGLLSAQDRAPLRPHVTVQNKVAPRVARALQAELEEQFQPRDFRFAALALHAYQGGPWQSLGRWSFRG